MNIPQTFRHLLVIEDKKSRRVIYLDKESTYSIGRDPSSSIIIYDTQVSRYHATILRVRDQQNNYYYRIIDGNLQGKRSTNGLNVNGRVCLSHDLKHGDVIRFGGRAKASYNIIPVSSDIDIFDEENAPEPTVASKGTLTDKSKQTMVADIQQEISPEKQEQDLLRLASFPELSPNPIIEIDWQGDITYANPAANVKFKTLEQDKLQHPILAGLLKNYQNRQGNLFVREIKIGKEVFEQYVHYLTENKVIRSYIFDFTKRKQIEASLRESEQRYKAVIKQTTEGIFLIDSVSKNLLEANDAYCQLLGYTNEEILKLNLYDLVSKKKEIVEAELEHILVENTDLLQREEHRCKDGTLLNFEVSISLISYGEKQIFCYVIRDLTAPKRLEQQIQYNAFHDLSTGLPNKKLFDEQLSRAIANAKRHQYLLSVMLLEIDKVTKIEETGKDKLDEKLYQQIGQRIKPHLRAGDILAHLDKNQFILLFSHVSSARDPAKIGKRLLEILQEPFEIDGQKIEIVGSIGIAVYPLDGEEQKTLLNNAATALTRSKEKTEHKYGLYGLTMTSQASKLLRLENLLKQALQKGEFLLYYQPQYHLKTQKITGVEALLRWQHPELGLVSPKQFLPSAEETNMIVPISKWVLETACAQNKAWQDAGFTPFPIAVNLSPRQFQQSNLSSLITQVLENTGLEARWLQLDITETHLSENLDFASKTIAELHKIGVSIALDDFTTGNSSLGYLDQFPIQTIKIAQSFILKLQDQPRSKALIKAIVDIGMGFEQRVIAEGVEKQEQLQLLQGLGCEEIQGYLFAPPLNLEDATNFLSRTHHTMTSLSEL